MGLKLITAPTLEPITLAELKSQCRVDTTDDDAVLALCIAAARAKAENYTGAAIMAQVWEQTLDAFPSAEIELLKRPAAPSFEIAVAPVPWSVSSVSYIDAAGATQTLSAALYVLDAANYPGWLLPAYGATWPATRDQSNAVTIRTAVGYADPLRVPADLKAWLLLTAAFVYAQRESLVVDGQVREIPGRFIDSLIEPYRVFKA